MPRVEWSFLMSADDHMQVKKAKAYIHSRMTVWGKILLLIIWVGLAISSVGIQISAYFLPSFILALLITSYIMALFFRPHVKAHRRLPPFPSAGHHYIYKVLVTNIGKRPLRNLAAFESCLPYGLYAAHNHPEYKNSINWLNPGEQQWLQMVIHVPRRGIFEIAPLILGTSFPSGILRARRKTDQARRFVVYPKIIRKENILRHLKGTFQPGGLSGGRKSGESNEFASTREYREGDRMRDVHWNSSARNNKLIVKEYIEEYFVRVGIFIDTELKRFEKHDSIEGRISLAAGLAEQLINEEYIIDFFLSDTSSSHMQSGRGVDDLEKCLEFLAMPEGDKAVDWNRCLNQLKEYASHLSTLYIFLKDWDEEREKFIETIHRLGISTEVIIVPRGKTTHPVKKGIGTVFNARTL